jgi:predicted metalloprotease
MRWDKDGPDVSPDVEDRRGESAGGGGGFGGGGGMRLGLGGFVLLAVLSIVFRKNFFALLDGSGGGGGPVASTRESLPRPSSVEDSARVKFVSHVLDDVQETWTRELPKVGHPYRHARLVLFTDAVRSGCGFAERAMGPFYCPMDQKVYIDLGFYDELSRRFGARGEFAQAYVIAHEVGHHVQTLLGIDEKVRRAQESRPDQANALSVRMELQADCLAGVWGHSTEQRNILEKGDLEAGLNAAAAVGDDRIQKSSTGRVNPERWTHGSSRQRVEWFQRGFTTGSVAACDTFGGSS